MRILYIEDNPNDATLVNRYVQTTAHELITVAGVAEAKQRMSQPFDLIMVDVLLGQGRDGYNFAQELRQQGYPGPMIAVTALVTPKEVEAYQRIGFDAVLAKPFTVAQLAALIDAIALKAN
jgi:CheY-like chemotaxis protein